LLGKIFLVLCKELFHDNGDEKKLESVELVIPSKSIIIAAVGNENTRADS